MLNFKDVILDDKDIIRSFTINNWRVNCELSFINIYSWLFKYRTQYTVKNDFLLLRFIHQNKIFYMMPIGDGNIEDILPLIIKDANEHGIDFVIQGVSQELCKDLEKVMPNMFAYETNRKYSDYVYLRENLVQLQGKKFQSKRNFINRFIKNNPYYEYKILTPNLVPHCLELERKWYKQNITPEESQALHEERIALTCALSHMEQLDLLGGALFVDNEIVAFTYGGQINYETFDVCIEKADSNIEGAYAMINNLFAKQIPEHFKYINREEDLGIPGLRKAKLSYNPEFLVEKHSVKLK